MKKFPHADRLENVHPFRLLLRFILFSVFLIIIFLFISYLILKSNSDENLKVYFDNIYLHTKNATERFIEDNIHSMKTIADFEPVHKFFEEFDSESEVSGNTFPDGSMSDRNINDLSGRSSIFFSAMPIPIKLVSRDGYILLPGSGNINREIYPGFDKIREITRTGSSSGIFFAVNQQLSEGPDKAGTEVVVFVKVTDTENIVIGYLVNEINLEMLGFNAPEPEFPDTNYAEGIYTIYKKLDYYFIDEAGRPLSKLLYEEEYRDRLAVKGIVSNYHELTVFYPDGPPAADGESNIELIRSLVEKHPVELIRNLHLYKNYSGVRVEGGVFWLDSLNAGVVMELDAAVAFSPYIYTMSIILLILILSFIVFLYLILWINRLRMRALDANPLTKLPGNTVINGRVQSMIDKRQAVTVVYADLDNFKAYNDLYGFSMGDEAIKFTADLLKNYIVKFPVKLSFCGHIGGDDFIFILPEQQAEETAAQIAEHFDSEIRQFYNSEHLEQGYIEEKNREGVLQRFPLISLSMAGIELRKFSFTHYLEVSNRCGELKKLAKKQKGSCLVMERRHT